MKVFFEERIKPLSETIDKLLLDRRTKKIDVKYIATSNPNMVMCYQGTTRIIFFKDSTEELDMSICPF